MFGKKRRSGYFKVFVLSCVAGALLIAGIYWKAERIAEAILQPWLEDRGAVVEIEYIRIQADGVSIRFGEYSEPGVTIHGLGVSVPWSSLLPFKETLALHVEGESLRVDAAMFQSESTAENIQLSEHLANASDSVERIFTSIADIVKESPVHSFDVHFQTFAFQQGGYTIESALDSSWLTGAEQVGVFSLKLKNVDFSLDVRMRVADEGQTIGIDFSGSASNWEHWLTQFSPDTEQWLLDQRVDVYMEPWQDGRFIDISGYARWGASQPEALHAALLGNVAAIQVFTNQGEFSTKPMAFGLATDGQKKTRAYLNLPIAASRAGAWMIPVGEFSLHLENSKAEAVIALEDIQLSAGIPDLIGLLEHDGSIEFEADVAVLDSTMIQALAPGKLPADVSFKGALQSRGQLLFAGLKLSDASAQVNWQMSRLDWVGKSVSIDGLSGTAQLDSLVNQVPKGSSVFQMDTMEVAGIVLSKLATRIRANDAGKAQVDEFNVQTMGGTIHADAFELDWKKRTSRPIRLAIRKVDLAKLARVVPQFKGHVTGSASGDLQLRFSASGLRLIDGKLSLDKNIPAHLSYSMNGLLTSGLRKGTDAYKQYQMAERALEDLDLQRFQIDFYPGDSQTKPIVVTFFGESKQDNIQVPIDYTLNVNTNDNEGLIQLLQMMQQGQLQIR